MIQESENGAMPHNHSALAGLTVLHMTQPVEGGVARVVTDLVRAQVRAGARVVVACPIREPAHAEPDRSRDAPREAPWDAPTDALRDRPGIQPLHRPETLPRAAARAGAEVVRWDARRSPGPGLVREVRTARRLIRAVRPDLLHLHSAKAGLAGRLAARGSLTTVFQPHAWSYEAVGGLTARAALRWERRAAHWSDCLLCVSRAERAAGESSGIHGAWTVVPNGVDTARFAPAGTPAEPVGAPGRDPGLAPGSAPGPGFGPVFGHQGCEDRESHQGGEEYGHRQGGEDSGGARAREVRDDRDDRPGWHDRDGQDDRDDRDDHPDRDERDERDEREARQGRAALRAALPALRDVGPDTPLVVCVGRLCRQKGQDVLLRAWPEVTARLPRARLALVGDGPDRRRLTREAPGSVITAGAAHDTAPWYRAADVVVLPSRWEGMALAPLEAMSCGRPVVVTDVGGARECLPPADAPACVVPIGDAHALAAALLRLLTDPALRTAAGARALAHVRERHDLRRSTAAVTALYAGLLGLPAPGRPERAALR
ncbi:glycosyltransferase [Streptomyces sp. HPF1205]|uniref:glycosyltransferase n=1 Tax=Streptomyces sp. HPF1205 TaxID=2873262 RepID=UPI0035ABABC3